MNEEQKPLPADIQPPVIQPPDIQPPSPAPHQREQLLNEVLLHVAAQMRTALGGMHMAVSRLAPPDRRDGDAALDRDAPCCGWPTTCQTRPCCCRTNLFTRKMRTW